MCCQDWLDKQETVLNPLTLAFRHFLLLPALFALALSLSLFPSSFLSSTHTSSSILSLFSILSIFVPSLTSFTTFITIQASSIR